MTDTTLPLAGAVSALRMLADGSMSVTLVFDPKDRGAVMAMMGEPGASIACVRLKDGHEAKSPAPAGRAWTDKGPIEKEAIELCRNDYFQHYASRMMAPDDGEAATPSEAHARRFVLSYCSITTRSQLDTAEGARELFIAHIRKPFHQWLDKQPK